MDKISVLFSVYINGKLIAQRRLSSSIPADSTTLDELISILVSYASTIMSLSINDCGIRVGNFYVTATCNAVVTDIVDIYGVIPANREDVEDVLKQCRAEDSLRKIVIDFALRNQS